MPYQCPMGENHLYCTVGGYGSGLFRQLRTYDKSEKFLFKMENMLFYSRLLEGYYPDTARLIPETASTEIVFNASSLLGSIERASLLSHEGKNNVDKVSITPDLVEISEFSLFSFKS